MEAGSLGFGIWDLGLGTGGRQKLTAKLVLSPPAGGSKERQGGKEGENESRGEWEIKP